MKNFLLKSAVNYQNIFEVLLIPCIVFFSLIAFLIFRNEVGVSLIGNGSLGLAMLIVSVSLCVLLFPPFYLTGLSLSKTRLPLRAKLFNTITLCLSIVLIAVMITGLIIALLNFISGDMVMDRFLASAIVGVYASLVAYNIVPTALDMSTTRVVRIFSFVVLAGVILSMITAGKTQWWQINFSALGTASIPPISSYTFNVTMIISGLLLISLSSHLISEIPETITGTKNRDRKIGIMEFTIILIGLSMASIGALPYDRFPRLHDTLAYYMAFVFLALVFSLKYLMPKINRAFVVNSYFAVAAMIFLYVLYNQFSYINLTAFELLSFLITLAWIIMFANRISRYSTQKNHRKY